MRPAALALATGLGVAAASVAVAQDQPVVIELFTSQGCSSCPPADRLLTELAARDDVIALALHVDYWDYIGWKDTFANPLYTARQKGYARAAGHRMIYTPQIVIAGTDHVIGFRPMEVADLIQSHHARPAPVRIGLVRTDTDLTVTLDPAGPLPAEMVVQLVRFKPSATVEIDRGENAGRTIDYSNIVTEWTRIGVWDGLATKTLTAPVPGDTAVAVILQNPNLGPIVAAAALR